MEMEPKAGSALTARQALDSCPAAAVFVRLHALSNLAPGSLCVFTDGVKEEFTAEAFDLFGGSEEALKELADFNGGQVGITPQGDAGVAGIGAGDSKSQSSRGSSQQVARTQSLPSADSTETADRSSATGVIRSSLFGASSVNSTVHHGQGFNMGLISGRHATEKTAKATSWAAFSGVATYAAFTAVGVVLPFTIPVLAVAGSASAAVKVAKFGNTAIEASRNSGEGRELRESLVESIKKAEEIVEELDFLIEGQRGEGPAQSLLGVARTYHHAIAVAALKVVDTLVSTNEAEIPVAIQALLSSASTKVGERILSGQHVVGRSHGAALLKLGAAFGEVRRRLANLCEAVPPEARGGADGLVFPLQCYAIALAAASLVLDDSQEVEGIVACMDVRGSEDLGPQGPVEIVEGDAQESNLRELPEGREWPAEMMCPILKLPMENPVMTNTGTTYEAHCLRNLHAMRMRDGQPFVDCYAREITRAVANRKLRELISAYPHILETTWVPHRIRQWEALFECPLSQRPFKSSSKSRHSLQLSPWLATDGLTYDFSWREKNVEGMTSKENSMHVKWVGPNYNVKKLQDLNLNDLPPIKEKSFNAKSSRSMGLSHNRSKSSSWW